MRGLFFGWPALRTQKPLGKKELFQRAKTERVNKKLSGY